MGMVSMPDYPRDSLSVRQTSRQNGNKPPPSARLILFPRLEDRIELEKNGLILDKRTVHALQHLEHFFSTLLGSKEFWAATLGAVFGGLITGRYALRAQKQAAADQRKRDLEIEARATKGVLRAIDAELRVFKSEIFDPLEIDLNDQARRRSMRATVPPMAMKRTEQNRLMIFESNADVIGKIDDDELRARIIRFYGIMTGLLDHLNAMARDFERWRSLDDSDLEKQTVARLIDGLELRLRDSWDRLQSEFDQVFKGIDKYLNR
jgi:hypothetical protein